MSSKNKILRPKIKTNYDRPTIKELDKLAREATLLKSGGWCEYPGCRKQEYLNVHHLYSRSRMSVRWDLDNLMVLCPLHHSLGNDSAHKDPNFKTIMIETGTKTKKFWDKLERKAKNPHKIDRNMEKLYLEQQLKILRRLKPFKTL